MNPILELVEMRLTRPFDEFIVFFETEQLPILLNAPGIKSVRTGTPSRNFSLSLLFTFVKDRNLCARANNMRTLQCPLLYGTA
jgi:hypothetical protein